MHEQLNKRFTHLLIDAIEGARPSLYARPDHADDKQSDIFALGVIFCEMATCKPFDSDTKRVEVNELCTTCNVCSLVS